MEFGFKTLLEITGAGVIGKIFFDTLSKQEATKILNSVINRINLPTFFQIIPPNGKLKDRFYGMIEVDFPTGYSTEQIKQAIYEVYCVCRGNGLTEPSVSTILLPFSFKEKSITDTIFFFEEAEEKWLAGLKRPYALFFDEESKVDFKNLVESFKPMCADQITGNEAYLLTICSGSLLGAKYSQTINRRAVNIASELTLKNKELSDLSAKQKLQCFIDVVSFLAGGLVEREVLKNLILSKSIEVSTIEDPSSVKNKKEAEDKLIESFDYTKLVCKYLNNLQSNFEV
jgi:hypothetical protein